ncbi:MAG: hypothetical protein JW768_01435 [Chitinispirillaceae bacterium]|nr:hypothetical protein [Chitinispirillaceae bacterium]
MIHEICDGVLMVEGEGGSRIGIGIGGPSMMLFVEQGSASTTEAAGTVNGTPRCRFEVRCDGAVGIGKQV